MLMRTGQNKCFHIYIIYAMYMLNDNVTLWLPICFIKNIFTKV